MKYRVLFLLLGVFFVTSCSGSKEMKDGKYKGTYSSEGDTKSTVNVEIEIKDGKIANVIAEELDKNDKIKDENYGKEAGDSNYKLAQKAVKGFEKYPKSLMETQDIDKVDSVSGATVSHKLFKEAVKDALGKAK